MVRSGLVGLLVALAGLAGSADAAENVVGGTLRATRGEAVATVTIAPGWHINAHQPRDEFLIPTTLEIEPPAGVQAGPVRYPDPVERVLAFSGGKSLALYEGTVRLAAPLSGAAAVGAPPLRARLRYQACNDTTCLPPRTLGLVDRTDVPTAAFGGGADVAAWVERWGWGVTLLWVAALGVALNLTPCVYPLVSVTVAFFGGPTGEAGTVRRAILYVLGICITFSVLGVAAALTGSLFGAALQQPLVLGVVALLMVLLGLSNFGLYQLRPPVGLMQWAGRVGEGAIGAFFMGLTMGIVAAPCIGPIVVALLLYVGAQQSAGLGFALFFALGAGMGLPYVGLALLASRLRRLPRSGAWLVLMERLFGFVLLGLALHFATPLLPAGWERFGWALLLASAGLVLGFTSAPVRPGLRWARRVAGLAVMALGLGSLGVAETANPIAWEPFSEQALVRATEMSRPAFIDFQAAWCIPCREMERTTFRDPALVRDASTFAMLRADVTTQDDRTQALMARFGVAGVPTYVLIGADGRERRRLVGYVDADTMRAALAEAAAG